MSTETAYTLTDEIKAKALEQVRQMKERDVSKRLFTAPTKTVVQNATNNRFKTEVNESLLEKLDDWQGDTVEYLAALETMSYASNKMHSNPSRFTRDDYVEYLVARIIYLGLESRANEDVREKLINVFGVDVDDMIIR